MPLRKMIGAAVLVLLVLLSGCAWFSSEEDVIIMSPLPLIHNQFQPIPLWKRLVGSGSGYFYSNLHTAWQNGSVFAADRYGLVKALDINSGKEIWSTDLSVQTGYLSYNRPVKLCSGITVADDRIYIGSELAKVYALNIHDGSLVWETMVAGEALSTPVVSDGFVLIHTSNGMLQALNETDGVVQWTVYLDMPLLTLRGESAPIVVFGVVLVGGDNGWMNAILIQQGQLIWQQRISHTNGTTAITRINDVQTTPVVVNNVVYAIAYNGKLIALSLCSGQVIWSRNIGSFNNVLVNRGRIYLVDQNDAVIAIDTQNGETIWRQSHLLHRNLTSPVMYNGYIVTGDSKGYLHWINTDDGRLVSQQKVDSAGLLATPLVADNKLIVQAKNGMVYAMTS